MSEPDVYLNALRELNATLGDLLLHMARLEEKTTFLEEVFELHMETEHS